jgi:hypothetical protein
MTRRLPPRSVECRGPIRAASHTSHQREELLRRRERYGVSYFTAVGLPMEALAAVIDRLAGG